MCVGRDLDYLRADQRWVKEKKKVMIMTHLEAALYTSSHCCQSVRVPVRDYVRGRGRVRATHPSTHRASETSSETKTGLHNRMEFTTAGSKNIQCESVRCLAHEQLGQGCGGRYSLVHLERFACPNLARRGLREEDQNVFSQE
jgi:hypothetical protein